MWLSENNSSPLRHLLGVTQLCICLSVFFCLLFFSVWDSDTSCKQKTHHHHFHGTVVLRNHICRSYGKRRWLFLHIFFFLSCGHSNLVAVNVVYITFNNSKNVSGDILHIRLLSPATFQCCSFLLSSHFLPVSCQVLVLAFCFSFSDAFTVSGFSVKIAVRRPELRLNRFKTRFLNVSSVHILFMIFVYMYI